MIIDIGGGTSEIAVIALGGIVVSHTPARRRQQASTRSIATYIRKKYNLMIGERTAEEVKIQIGTALPLERELTMEVRGRDLIAGLPRTIPITQLRGHGGDRGAAPAARRRGPQRPRADAAGAVVATSSTRAWSCPAAAPCCATSTSS